MGAAGSIAPGVVPDDIQALYDLTERQKAKVAEIDSTMLDAEMGKMFKGHNKVIDELCSRSKTQLKSLVEKYPTVAKHLEALNSSGNPYAKFILDSSVPKADFDMECIKAAGDYDEELLVAIIGTSGTKELRRLNELYTQQFSFGIADLCATKNKADAGFAKFVQRIFRFDRDESKEVDYDEAERLLEIIHKAGAARLLGVDEDAIIDVLATTSRVQCMAINELYQKRHKMKLERALNMKFKGTFSKLLILWTTPLPGAIVNCAGFLMQKIIPDKNAIMRFFARFDKDLLKLADAACRELHQKSLAEHLSSALSGNLLRALKVWIEEASPDKGFQKIIDIYIEGKLDEGYSLEEIYRDAELLAKLQFLLEKLAGELKLFLITHKEKIDPADLAIMTRSQASVQGLAKTVSDIKLKQQSMRNFTDLALSSDGDEDSSSYSHHGRTPKTPKTFHMEFDIPELPDEDAEAESATKEMMAQRKFSIVLPNSIQRNVHEQLINHTYAYLISVFENADDDAEGSLEVDLFWETLGKLPIHLFGFVPRDLELIKKTSAWENDGRVYYYEALLEFADSVVTAIENKEDDDEANGGRDVIKIIDRLTKEKEDQEENEDKLGGNINFSMDRAVYATKSSSRRTLSIRFGNIPVYFRQYVIDTVAAFDMDCSGYLKEQDLVKLLEALQVPQDTLNYQYFVDNYPKSTSTKGPVAMFDLKYCAETVFKVINAWFTDGAEHYICLMDKNSGAYFWFNTLDQSTQWVDNSVTGEVSSEFKDFVLDEAVVASAAANDSADAKMASEAPAKSPRTESKSDVADEKGAPTDENEEKFGEASTKGSVRSSREEKEATSASESSKPSLNRSRTSPEDLCDAKHDDAAASGSRKLATSQSVDAIDMAGDGSAADKDTEPTASGQDDLQEEE